MINEQPCKFMNETTEMTKPKVGEISWNELMAKDTKAAAGFYGKLFGWQPTPFVPEGATPGMPPYTLFKTDANSMGIGGMLPTPHPDIPTQWIPYVVVENIESALSKAVKLGAKTCVPVTSIGDIGRIAVIQDPQGATLGLHESPK
jgi:predicted enzyme related to lactoylglutathione lyase